MPDVYQWLGLAGGIVGIVVAVVVLATRDYRGCCGGGCCECGLRYSPPETEYAPEAFATRTTDKTDDEVQDL